MVHINIFGGRLGRRDALEIANIKGPVEVSFYHEDQAASETKININVNSYIYESFYSYIFEKTGDYEYIVNDLEDDNYLSDNRWLKLIKIIYHGNSLADESCNMLNEKIKNLDIHNKKVRLGGICLWGYFSYLIAKKLKKLNPDLEIELTTYATPLQQYLPLIDGVKWVQYYNPRDKLLFILNPFIPHPNYSILINTVAAAYLTLFVVSMCSRLQISLSISSVVIVFFSSVLFFRIVKYLTLAQKSRATLVPSESYETHNDVWHNLLNGVFRDSHVKIKNVYAKYESLSLIVSKAFFIPDNNNIKDVKFIDNQEYIELQESLDATALALKNKISDEKNKISDEKNNISDEENKPIWLIGHGKGGHVARKTAELLAKEKPNIKINLVTIATALQQWEQKPTNVEKWYKFHNRYDLTQKFRAFFASHEKYSKHSYLISLVIEIFIVQICNIYSVNISILAAFFIFVSIMFLHRFLEYNLISHDNTSVHIPSYSFNVHNSIQNSSTQDRIAEQIILNNPVNY
jgi:hypothetical protein